MPMVARCKPLTTVGTTYILHIEKKSFSIICEKMNSYCVSGKRGAEVSTPPPNEVCVGIFLGPLFYRCSTWPSFHIPTAGMLGKLLIRGGCRCRCDIDEATPVTSCCNHNKKIDGALSRSMWLICESKLGEWRILQPYNTELFI